MRRYALHQLMLFPLLVLLALCSTKVGAAERVTYFVPDALGSPVVAMDEQGAVLWRENYAPYGQRQAKSPANNAKPAYTGKPEDSDTGLVYMGARMHDPEAARFTGIDPQGFKEENPQTFGRYAYANNSPYVYVDPDGEAGVPGITLLGVAALLTKEVGGEVWTSATGLPAPFSVKQLAAGIAKAGGRHNLFDLVTPKSNAELGLQPKAGEKVFRVIGEKNNPMGESWTPVDPAKVGNYREAAGLPGKNTGRFVIEGEIVDPAGISNRFALPIGENKGGMLEYVVKDADKKISITRVSGANPEF